MLDLILDLATTAPASMWLIVVGLALLASCLYCLYDEWRH